MSYNDKLDVMRNDMTILLWVGWKVPGSFSGMS